MRQMLIYGDSNVYGQGNYLLGEGRMNEDAQWPRLLEKKLGANWRVLAEGLPGRVAGQFLRLESFKNGRGDIFKAVLLSSTPLDFILIALGTNDLMPEHKRTPDEILADLLWFKRIGEAAQPEAVLAFLEPSAMELADPHAELAEQKRLELIAKMHESGLRCISLPRLPLSDGVHFTAEAAGRVAELVYYWLEDRSLV